MSKAPCLAALCLLILAPAAFAAEWSVRDARVTVTPMPARLEALGLELVAVRGEAVRDAGGEARPSFRTGVVPDLRVIAENGRITGFAGRDLSFDGGLLFRVRDPATGSALAPLMLVDFSLEVAASDAAPVRFRAMEPGAPAPLEVRNAAFGLDPEGPRVLLRAGDLTLGADWARSIGRPELAGEWLGGVDVTLTLSATAEEMDGERAPEPEPRGGTLDVLLGELYGMLSAAREGTYPDGSAGLAAATTSCNNGTVNVPWNEPMAETHPFIGLALFRVENGVLEQIGRSWIKHGWFAFANDQCDLGCVGGGGSYLAVGCSDTYSAYNNASLFTLGPRPEVNPHTGDWDACGSFFDDTPVDCERDYYPPLNEEQFNVDHRMQVADADLGRMGAVYRYEGCYYVKDDADISNNIGWRECTMTWTGTNWSFDEDELQLAPDPGPVVATWGDQTANGVVAADDGEAWLSVAVTDLGGGQWHYEYALYNRTSARAVREFSVPVGSANVSAIGFRDLDADAGNDWTAQVADGLLTWSTDDFATDPDASVLEYQMLFNFRFDADAGPQPADARGGLFRAGAGGTFFLATQAPAAGATAVPEIAAGADRGARFTALEPNPFASGAHIRFSRPEPGATRLSVLDVGGRTVRVLLDGPAPAGAQAVRWDGRDDQGRAVASGVYFVRLEDGDVVRTAKLTRLR